MDAAQIHVERNKFPTCGSHTHIHIDPYTYISIYICVCVVRYIYTHKQLFKFTRFSTGNAEVKMVYENISENHLTPTVFVL